MDSISIVVPMYNEEKEAAKSIKKLINALRNLDYELVIVESGSTDNTASIVDELAKKYIRVLSYHQKRKEGLGSAIRYGLKKSKNDLVLYMDGDDPFDVNVIEKALPLIDGVDAVLGYRIGGRESYKRWFFSKAYNILIKTVFGLKVKDVNFSFKLMRRNVVKNISLRANGFFIDAEIIAEMKRNGFIWKELGIPFTERKDGVSSVQMGPKLIFNMLGEMLNYMRR